MDAAIESMRAAGGNALGCARHSASYGADHSDSIWEEEFND